MQLTTKNHSPITCVHIFSLTNHSLPNPLLPNLLLPNAHSPIAIPPPITCSPIAFLLPPTRYLVFCCTIFSLIAWSLSLWFSKTTPRKSDDSNISGSHQNYSSDDKGEENCVWIVLKKRLISNIECYLMKEKVGRGGYLEKTLRSPIVLTLVKLFRILTGQITILRVPTSCTLCIPTLFRASYFQKKHWVSIFLYLRPRISNIFTVYPSRNVLNPEIYLYQLAILRRLKAWRNVWSNKPLDARALTQ